MDSLFKLNFINTNLYRKMQKIFLWIKIIFVFIRIRKSKTGFETGKCMLICESTCQEAGKRPQESSQLTARLRASSRFPDLHTLDSKHHIIVRSSEVFLWTDFADLCWREFFLNVITKETKERRLWPFSCVFGLRNQ